MFSNFHPVIKQDYVAINEPGELKKVYEYECVKANLGLREPWIRHKAPLADVVQPTHDKEPVDESIAREPDRSLDLEPTFLVLRPAVFLEVLYQQIETRANEIANCCTKAKNSELEYQEASMIANEFLSRLICDR